MCEIDSSPEAALTAAEIRGQDLTAGRTGRAEPWQHQEAVRLERGHTDGRKRGGSRFRQLKTVVSDETDSLSCGPMCRESL